MPVPPEHAHRYVYHFSHIDNLAGLLQTGFLANNHPDFPAIDYHSVAAAGIQERRAKMAVTCGPGGCVHDYVPLYFGATSPMLLGVIQAKNVDQSDILYFEFPIALVDRASAVFTNASANTIAPPDFFHDPAQLVNLDWAAIDSRKWGNPEENYRHRRMAELLVHQTLSVTDAARCVVWNETAKARVEQIVGDRPFPPIGFQVPGRYHWFLDFMNKKRSSLVLGPRDIAAGFAEACEAIARERGKHEASAKFADLDALLENLRSDFGCLPHTAELIGLESANGIHKRTVDVHTKEVVDKLRTLPEFGALNQGLKDLVEIAAYLHDIGKGPRSRWDESGGLQQVDPNHPVGAMPMIVEILTRYVGEVPQEDAEAIAKLVCYHDLMGDVLGRGRDEGQVIDVADDAEELNMLFALGKADATVLMEHWWPQARADGLYGRCLAALKGA